MEQTQSQKLGAGIIVISILHFIGAALGVFGTIVLLTQQDTFAKQGIQIPLTNTQIIISLVLTILMVIGVILILLKKSIGVYCYFAITLLSLINTIMDNGFQWTIIFSLIFPILMAVFINNKKQLFNF